MSESKSLMRRLHVLALPAVIIIAALFIQACAVEQPEKPKEAPPSPKVSEPRREISRAAPELPSAKPRLEQKTTRARKHMIVAANPLAAQVGRRVLRQGGTAMDAAIAAQMVLNVVEPQSSGIGGGGFLLYYDAEQDRLYGYDGRETAPEGATPDMFLKPLGGPMDFFDAVTSGKSVGVPGLVAMLTKAHENHGRMAWRHLLRRAQALAGTGFKVSPRLANLLKRDKYLRNDAGARDVFYNPDGTPKRAGQVLKNPALSDTLARLRRNPRERFYEGRIADAIAQTVQDHDGTLSAGDLKAYNAKTRPPVCAPYYEYLVCAMGPPTSGGVAVLQILRLLQLAGIHKYESGSPRAAHLLIEASRLAYADRAKYLADPDYVHIPVKRLLDAAYLSERAEGIRMDRSMGRARPGQVNDRDDLALHFGAEGLSTTHISVVDQWGNAVSMTTSIENAFGSRIMTQGFLLNNQLTDFSFLPERNGAPVANRVEPGKRPRSSMSPVMVFDRDRRLHVVLGSPGGSRIIGYVAKALVEKLTWNKDIQAAVSAPHITNRNGMTTLEKDSRAVALKQPLEALGHQVQIRPLTSGLHGIVIRGSFMEGGADPRREGVALGD